MTCIFINPVVDRMYKSEELAAFLKRHGFERVFCKKDHAAIVLEKYRKFAAGLNEGETAADIRCPAARKLLAENAGKGLLIPDIEPILLHCAREIAGRGDLSGRKKIITTPCAALEKEGNALGLKDTEFVAWTALLKRLCDSPSGKSIDKSPIPPGFFKNSGLAADSVTGEENILEYLRKKKRGNVGIAEFLYCRDGCHNGDGVLI